MLGLGLVLVLVGQAGWNGIYMAHMRWQVSANALQSIKNEDDVVHAEQLTRIVDAQNTRRRRGQVCHLRSRCHRPRLVVGASSMGYRKCRHI
ncbi:hypothetical protein BC831DRAFT_2944 [Entophlyctis helioformis]|nr:hypothetical protein BC831DRAFT_2944 [Entophlyctis helioformis]